MIRLLVVMHVPLAVMMVVGMRVAMLMTRQMDMRPSAVIVRVVVRMDVRHRHAAEQQIRDHEDER